MQEILGAHMVIGRNTANIEFNDDHQKTSDMFLDGDNFIVIEQENDFDFTGNEYRFLFENSSATAFQSPVWLEELYRQLAPNRSATKVVITGRDQTSGALLFVLPLITRKLKGITLLESADLGVCDYSAPIVHQEYIEQISAIENLSSKIKAEIGKFDILRLKPVRDKSRIEWEMFFEGQFEQLDFSSHEAALGEDYAEWRDEHFDAKHRKKIDQNIRRITNHHESVSFDIVPASDCGEIITKIQSLRAGRFEGDPIQEDFVLSFYKKIAEQGQLEGFARTYVLKANGEFVGALFGLTNNKTHHGMLMACDYDAFGKFSPVFGMVDLLMADWHKDGGRICDFDIGDEPFKPKFGTKPVKLFKMTKAMSPKGVLALKVLETANRSL